jgi:hypothetical protein
MSIDIFHFIRKGENPSDIRSRFTPHESPLRRLLGAGPGEGTHTIYEMRAGVEHLYIFEDGAEAVETFERWRRQPCETIALTLDGVEQAGGRLPVGTKPGDGCDVDVSWNGEYDTDGDANSPAGENVVRWPVRCGQPVAGEVQGRPFCQRHIDLTQQYEAKHGFAISLGRESNLPTMEDVELGDTAIDGATLSSKLGDAPQDIDFGNGSFGLLDESGGLCYMATPNPLDHRYYGQSGAVTELASTPTVDGSTSTTGNQEAPRMLPAKCSTYTLVETERQLPSSMTADDENGLLLHTKIEIRVYGDKVVLEHTDESMERAPIDITRTALGELLLKAEKHSEVTYESEAYRPQKSVR